MGNIITPDESKIATQVGAKKMAWLAIQCSTHGDEDLEWTYLWPEDVPDWVKEEEVISKMMEGKMVCADPDKNTMWYRAVLCDAPEKH